MEKSWPWDTNPPTGGAGDGATGLSEGVAREFLSLYFLVNDPTQEGVSVGVGQELQASGTASPIQIGTGSGVCYGLYINDEAVNIPVSTPIVGVTGGRIVLQTNWAGVGGSSLEARTRLALKMSSDGVPTPPALTQNAGTTWEIGLWDFTVTTGGVINLVDRRVFRTSTFLSKSKNIADQSITTEKLAYQAVTTDKIGANQVTSGKLASNSVNTSKLVDQSVVTGKLEDFAVETAKLANSAVTNSKIANGAVISTKIQDGAVTSTKIPNNTISNNHINQRVVKLQSRIGGNTGFWDEPGTATQTVGPVKKVVGSSSLPTLNANSQVYTDVTMSESFSGRPIIIGNVVVSSETPGTNISWYITNVTSSSFRIRVQNNSSNTLSNLKFFWEATGGG